MQLDHFPVFRPDGKVTVVSCRPKDLYQHIVKEVGSPFDHATVTQGFGLYVHDEGLLNGMELNVPIALVLGAPICGPAMLVGPPDRHGNTTYPTIDDDLLQALVLTAERLHAVYEQVAYNRANPFTLEFFNG